jgi:hypothetical protein
MRQIIIYSTSKAKISKSIIRELKKRNTSITYAPIKLERDSPARLELYGYDGKLKYQSSNISTNKELIKELNACMSKIDKMPMGYLEAQLRTTKTKIQKANTRTSLLRKCNLPDIPETSHCFADTTHHTCCMLGSKSREYADSSGNPIGALSLKVQRKTKKNTASNQTLTPWCTCTGSKVCTYYTDKFGKEDGTHIKFIGKLSSKEPDAKNEATAIIKLGLMQHNTPGIDT